MTALLALALTALPAMAQAAPTLRSGGAIVKKGTHVVAVSSDFTFEWEAGKLTCEEILLVDTVTSNPAATLAADGGTTTGCKAGGVAPWETKSIEFAYKFLEGETGEGFFKWVYNFPAEGLTGCHLEGYPSTTWTNGSAVVKFHGTLTGGGGSAGCPKKATISGELMLETDEAETGKKAVPVTVNNS